MMATNNLTIKEFFAGLYAHTDIQKEPTSAGRQMGGHFSTRLIDEDGKWLNLTEQKKFYLRHFSYCRTNAKTSWFGVSL